MKQELLGKLEWNDILSYKMQLICHTNTLLIQKLLFSFQRELILSLALSILEDEFLSSFWGCVSYFCSFDYFSLNSSPNERLHRHRSEEIAVYPLYTTQKSHVWNFFITWTVIVSLGADSYNEEINYQIPCLQIIQPSQGSVSLGLKLYLCQLVICCFGA